MSFLRLFNKIPKSAGLVPSLGPVVTVLGLAMCLVTLSLSTYQRADGYYYDIVDYCFRNWELDQVKDFLESIDSEAKHRNYISDRSYGAANSLEILFVIWLAVFVVQMTLVVLKGWTDKEITGHSLPHDETSLLHPVRDPVPIAVREDGAVSEAGGQNIRNDGYPVPQNDRDDAGSRGAHHDSSGEYYSDDED
jgi:hypothetical protein